MNFRANKQKEKEERRPLLFLLTPLHNIQTYKKNQALVKIDPLIKCHLTPYP